MDAPVLASAQKIDAGKVVDDFPVIQPPLCDLNGYK